MTFRLLLVDDNVDHRFLTRRALRGLEANEGLVVSVADDGETALEILQADPLPDLVLLDIKMPRRDGFELLREVRGRARTSGLAIIMFTSSENKVDVARARELGADDYVTKPLDATAFQAKVRDVVIARMASSRT